MKKRTLFFLAGAAALGAVSIAEGVGPFNRLRFKAQHEAVARYVETHYPHALYSPITQTDEGWVTVIRSLKQPPIMLYITAAPSGEFIFKEVKSAKA